MGQRQHTQSELMPLTLIGHLKRQSWLAAVIIPNIIIWTVVVFVPFPHDAAAHRTCDAAVAQLLTSDSLVEIERSRVLIHELNCGVMRRLPKD